MKPSGTSSSCASSARRRSAGTAVATSAETSAGRRRPRAGGGVDAPIAAFSRSCAARIVALICVDEPLGLLARDDAALLEPLARTARARAGA